MTQPVSRDPLHLAISKSKGLSIDWSDGHVSRFSNEYLRDECPCASCTGAHGTPPEKSSYSNPQAANPFQMYQPKLKMLDVEEVGSYAIRVRWSDGHNAGIYSFDYLRSICPCETCSKDRQAGER
jgi:DUF971 family protein